MTRSAALPRFGATVVVAALCFCVLGAQPAQADQWMVPASANVSGSAGTNWRTDLRLVNPEDIEIPVRVFLLRAGADNSALDEFFDVIVPAGGQVEIDNVLASEFSFSGTAALLIDTLGNGLVVTSRTYNQVTQGTYGQFIPGVPVDQALEADGTGYLVYMAKSADYRTNVGWAGTGADAGMITVSIFGANGSSLGSGDYVVRPYGQQQINDIFAAVGAPARAAAYATVTATVPVVAYASVVDNRTGDPVAVIAVPAPGVDANLLLSGVARASGVGDSLWRTDVRIFGAGESAGTVTMAYHPKGVEVTNPSTVSLAIGPGRLLALDDVMSSAFGRDAANGALRITADVPLMVLARTYNQSPSGTYGQSISADPFDNLIEAGREVSFSGVQGGDFRSNALFFNGGSAVTEVELELVAADGTVEGSRSITLLAGETDQVNDLLAFFDLPKSDAPHTLKVSPTSGGPVSAGVSTIDGDSGDPSYETGLRCFSRSFCYQQGAVCLGLEPPEPGLEVIYTWVGEFEGEVVHGGMARDHISYGLISGARMAVVDRTIVDFNFNGFDVFFDTYSVDEYQMDSLGVVAGLRSSYSEVTAGTGDIEYPPQTYQVTYTPPWNGGPLLFFCEGEYWHAPSVTETTVTTAGGQTNTTTEATPPSLGHVISVDEVLQTGAGAIPTVHLESWTVSPDGTLVTEQWISIEHGVVLAQFLTSRSNDSHETGIVATEIIFPDP